MDSKNRVLQNDHNQYEYEEEDLQEYQDENLHQQQYQQENEYIQQLRQYQQQNNQKHNMQHFHHQLEQQQQFHPIQEEEENEPKHQQYEPQQKGQLVTSPSKPSQEVLKRVFDDDQYYNRSTSNKDDQMNQIAYNLSKINLNQQNNEENQEEQINQENIDLNLFDQCYKTFLQKIAADTNFVNATYEQKIDILIKYFQDENLDFRLGSLIFLFELIYNFRDSLTEQAIVLILTQIYFNIPHYYEQKDFYMVYSSLEIIALIGPHNISYNNIKLLASILIDEALPILQDKAFLALINLDYPGFYALLDIANKDFNDIPLYIQNKFAQTEEIQLLVIIPSLLNDINTGDMKKKIQSLCALNKMFSLIPKANGLPLLVNILNEGNIDRQHIVSVIRACGEIGEQTLLKILKTTPNSKIKIAITTVLSWRVQKYEKNKLKIKIVPYSVAQHYNVNPGTMCIYYGDQTPLAFIDQSEQQQQESQEEEPYIEINTRDFMAALQRLMAIKYDKFQREFDENQQMHDFTPFLSQFTLAKLIDPSLQSAEQNDVQNAPISQNIIKCLCSLIIDENPQVRETAVNTLGLIGLPEAQAAIEPLYNALKDPESQVRAMAAWCLGRLGDVNPPKVAKRLIQLLKDNYWKVRTAACVSLGSIGHNIQEIAFPALTKALRDGTINKLTICETLVRLGVYGEQILIDLLKNVPQSNFKLKAAIIQSFEIANVQSPRIDFVIEELFRNASDQMIEVRKACLQTLEVLRNRAQDSNITYLKSRNVLPLFYFFLQDPSAEIRKIALESIQSFGPQAELMFIEGLTKDKNPIIRCECAKGLGQLGVQNFRALLFGLRDANQNVRKQTSISIIQNFQAEMIIEEFSQKVNQIPALLCNIKDILSLPFSLDLECKNLLEQVLHAFGENAPETHNQSQQQVLSSQQTIQQQYGDKSSQQSQNQQQKPQFAQYQPPNYIPAQKMPNNIPNMRGGMPAYTYFKPPQYQQQQENRVI